MPFRCQYARELFSALLSVLLKDDKKGDDLDNCDCMSGCQNMLPKIIVNHCKL